MSLNNQAMTEVEVAKIAEMFFAQRGWELFPEVVIKGFNGRPDLVGKKHQLCAVIECKKTLSYPVIEQLTRWRHDHNYRVEKNYTTKSVSAFPHLLIAFTGGNNKPLAALKKEILRQHRIGVYEIKRMPHDDRYKFDKDEKLGVFYDHGIDIAYCQWEGYRYDVREVVPPKIQEGSRRTAHLIMDQLNNDMKVATAGSSGKEGAYMTPFRRTMNAVEKILARGGSYHIVDIMNTLHEDFGGHHYSSDSAARSSIPKFIIELGIGEKLTDMPPRYRVVKTKQQTI